MEKGKRHFAVHGDKALVSNTRTVTLPADVCELAEKRFGKRFASLDDWTTAILKQLLLDESSRMDEKEQRMLEERLKALGYL
jgi:hypothetical protein